MNVKIIKSENDEKGRRFTFLVGNRQKKILYLFHALERIEKWQLSIEIVAETLLFPEEVIRGHRDRYIAHRRYDRHLVRAVYEYEDTVPVLLTVYFPYIERYFKGGYIHEDKIL